MSELPPLLRRLGFWLAIAAVLGLAAVNFQQAWQRLDRPFQGFLVTAGHEVEVVYYDRWTGIRAGLQPLDRLVSMDGRPIATSRELEQLAAGKPVGTPIVYEVARPGEPGLRRVVVPTQLFGRWDWLGLFLMFWLVGLLHLAIGAVVSLRRPGDPAATAHWLYCVAMAAWMVSNFNMSNFLVSHGLPLAVPVNLLATAMLGPLAANLALRVPRRLPWLDRRPGLVHGLLATGAIAAVANALWVLARPAGAPYLLLIALASLGVLSLPLAAFLAWRSPSSPPRARAQALVILAGTLAGYAPAIALTFLGCVGITALGQELSYLALALPPLAIAYAILRHGLFDLDLLLKRTLVFSLVTAALATAYVPLSGLARVLLGDHPAVGNALLTAALVLIFVPVRDGGRQVVERLFGRRTYDFQAIVAAFGEEARGLVDAEGLATAFVRRVEPALGPRFLAVMAPDGAAGRLLAGHGPPPPPTAFDGEQGESADGSLWLPLVSDGAVLGVIHLGPRTCALPYGPADRRLLATLADHLAACLRSATLFQTLRSQAAELARANADLQALDHAKTEFFKAAAHDLRTPLTTVIGYAEMLADGAAGALTPHQAAFVSRLQQGAQRLQRLSDNLIVLARLEAGTLGLAVREVELPDDLLEPLEALKASLEAGGNPLDLTLPSEPVRLQVDPERILQVVVNLVDNAARHSPPGGRIRVAFKHDSGVALIEVADQGPGIDPATRGELFKRYRQMTPEVNRVKGGAGLGLAISKALVEAHGGRIGVESPPGEGATFWFDLPLNHDT